ncbi:MAG: fumarate hydratase [Chloroflexota bacterium]
MREISASLITGTVARLFQEANYHLPEDVLDALKRAQSAEESDRGREVLGCILENAAIAARGELPLCQDTGAAVVFLEIGQEVIITGQDLYSAVNDGVRQGYQAGYLRKSMVYRPFSERRNSQDNTPAVIHTEIVPGNSLKISVMPKGSGAENMTRLAMLTPAQGRQGIIDFVTRSVEEADGSPCPPVIIGVGIGGTAEKAALLAKKALLRKVGEANADPEIAGLENEILERTNRLGIGPMGYGGRITALAVHAEVFPCHIASLPVVVNLQCHSARHRAVTI